MQTRNDKHKLNHTIVKLLTRQQNSPVFGKINRLERKNPLFSQSNKRHLRADGFILLPSALRPRLLAPSRQNSEITRLPLQNIESTEQTNSHFWTVFASNRGTERQNLVKFVVLSTISFGISTLLANSATPVSAASLTLTLPSDPLSIDLSPVDEFKESDTASVSIATTDANWGYNFSIKAKDNNTLKNGEFVLNSISQNYTPENFPTSAPVNTWGFKPSKKDSANNTNYLPGPTSSETLIEKTTTNSSASTNYTFSIAAKIDSSLKHGQYSNNFILTVIANTASYTITYNLNGGSTGPSPQTGTTTEKSITLSSTAPSKSGYSFLGWCTRNPSTATTCSGTTYQPGKSYPLSSDNTNTTLYAIWKSTKPTYGQTCNSTGKVLKDGRCWSKSDVNSGTNWNTANTLCKSPWRLPSQYDFNGLIRAYYPSASASGTGYYYFFRGDAATFTNDWGAASGFWWSSAAGGNGAYYLYLSSSSISSYDTNNYAQVRCVSEV